MNDHDNPLESDLPIDPIDELLVAYLDGELPPPEAEMVERKLADSEDVRRRLQRLESSAEMLVACLPRSAPTQAFTQATVTLAAKAAEQETSARLMAQQRTTTLWWGIGICLAVASLGIGYWGTYEYLQAPNRQLQQDLPVIQHYDEYRTADSVDFLKQLREAGLFQEELDDAL